jgi:pyrrolysine biosynthesis protein PylD
MTRLTPQDVAPIPSELGVLEERVAASTGVGLLELACEAMEVDPDHYREAAAGMHAMVIPMTAGQGVIRGFSEAVRTVVEHLGLRCSVSEHPDARGLAEAFRRRAQLLLFADDHCFVCVNTRTGGVVENSQATGRIFARALARMATQSDRESGKESRRCLVLGGGPVGESAARALLEWGFAVGIHDVNEERLEAVWGRLNRRFPGAVAKESSLDRAAAGYPAILDATPAAGILTERNLAPGVVVSVPGVPPGVTAGARRMLGRRFYHDALPSGVAAMVVGAVASAPGGLRP